MATSWCDIAEALRERLASGDNTVGSVTRGDKSVTYRSVDEFFKLLDRAETYCARERGNLVTRTYGSPS